MIYWFTGQPGHGKTLHAIDQAFEFLQQGRMVFVCNVRGFQHEKARMLPMTPEQFCDWMNFLPDGAVALVDEAYEHGMLPKRPPGSKVPLHVQQLAKHRHRGLDFIFVSQSPAKQVDEFVHDLIERHVHVRRRFGLPFAHLRIFDRFERNPEKRPPLILKRVRLPKRPMGLYESTVLDTTERRIPWYYIVFIVGIPVVSWWIWHAAGNAERRLRGDHDDAPKVTQHEKAPTAGADGAKATAATAGEAPKSKDLRQEDYVAWMKPRIGGQPWTAPAYDHLQMPNRPPRVFCMSSGHDGEESCTCKTEQGTSYKIEANRCRLIAREGQYEPFLDERLGEYKQLDEITQRRNILRNDVERSVSGAPGSAASSAPASVIQGSQIASYGDIAVGTAANK